LSIFLQLGVENLPAWLGMEPTASDLMSLSGVNDLSATAKKDDRLNSKLSKFTLSEICSKNYF